VKENKAEAADRELALNNEENQYINNNGENFPTKSQSILKKSQSFPTKS
jgi:hypothetical protein